MFANRSAVSRTSVQQSFARAGLRARRIGRANLQVANFTKWELHPDDKWCQDNASACQRMPEYYNLSGMINDKIVECFCTKPGDETNWTKGSCDFAINCDQTGVKVEFRTKSPTASNVDTENELYVVDLGGDTRLLVDGTELQPHEERKIGPGSKIAFGQEMVFKVMRNVHAHA